MLIEVNATVNARYTRLICGIGERRPGQYDISGGKFVIGAQRSGGLRVRCAEIITAGK